MIKKIKITYLTLLVLAISTLTIAQDRQGNIVEYFGKEKVEDIHEGKVLHVFKEGLLMTIPSMGFNSNSTPKKPVYARFLLDNPGDIVAGSEFLDNNRAPLSWEKIEVSEILLLPLKRRPHS